MQRPIMLQYRCSMYRQQGPIHRNKMSFHPPKPVSILLGLIVYGTCSGGRMVEGWVRNHGDDRNSLFA